MASDLSCFFRDGDRAPRHPAGDAGPSEAAAHHRPNQPVRPPPHHRPAATGGPASHRPPLPRHLHRTLVGSAAELKTGVNIGDSDFTDLIDDTSLPPKIDMIRSRCLKIKERVEPLTFVAVMQNDPENSSTQNNNNITRSTTADQSMRSGFPNTNKNLKYIVQN